MHIGICRRNGQKPELSLISAEYETQIRRFKRGFKLRYLKLNSLSQLEFAVDEFFFFFRAPASRFHLSPVIQVNVKHCCLWSKISTFSAKLSLYSL